VISPAPDYAVEDRRSRELIRGARDRTLFVEAGAGTGKTSALVDRFVALVLGGKAVERIVAITFTEKAAAELRDRVRSGLERVLVSEAAPRDVIERALASLDRAQISTIHSFAQTVLRSFAAWAHVDPDFRVQDELLAERRLQERWRMYLERLGRDPRAETVVDRVLSLGLETRHLEELARNLVNQPGLAQEIARLSQNPPVPRWPDIDGIRERLAALNLATVPAGDALLERVENIVALVESLAAAPREEREAVLASGALALRVRWGVGRGENWVRAGGIKHVRDTMDDIAQQLNDLLRRCRTQALAELLPYLITFVEEEERERGREGLLTFDDLILHVQRLLASNEDAVRALRARYDALLIDEFQDTDPLQVAIAVTFATDPNSGRLEPGRLFVVGDPKQSIYRFRGADMAVYDQTRERIRREGGEFLELALNRRSRQPILEWVNAVFERIIHEERGVQPQYRPIHPTRDMPLNGPAVAWMGEEVDGVLAREVRRIEADALAERCLAVVAEGWEVFDRSTQQPRRAQFRDIAVLIPRRIMLPPLERALSAAGIPYRVEGGSLLYRTQEVRDLLNCLEAIDDPADEVAIVAALRSPAFACSDVDLAEYRVAGGSFNYLHPGLKDCQGAVAEALRVLADYHQRRHQQSLAALVESFAAERGLAEIGVLDQGDRNSFRRVRYVVEQARAFESAGPESLRAFVNWMERRSNQAILDNEGAGVDDDEDAVRVLTIHGAKGLEFPIVFLAGLGAASPPFQGNYFWDRLTGEVAVRCGAKSRGNEFTLGDVDRLTGRESFLEDAELARLLYVGATRARDHLVVSLYHKRGNRRGSKPLARRLIEAGAQRAARLPEGPAPQRVDAAPFGELAVDEAGPASASDFSRARQELVDGAIKQRHTSATALGALRKEENSDLTEPWSRGRAATRLGRAVHAAVQSLVLDADEEMIAAFSRAQAVAEAIPGRAPEVERLVRRILRSEAAERGRRARRSLREAPFAMLVDGHVLEGFIDLLIETDDGIEIVDWKTDQIDREEVEERLREYRLQAGLYVLGIKAATGRRVNRVTYVFASAGVERSPGDPDTLAAEALNAVQTAAPPRSA
jgi:ATP-dependent helicase/nuclease subunit A